MEREIGSVFDPDLANVGCRLSNKISGFDSFAGLEDRDPS